MNLISQSSGDCRVQVETDGSPLWAQLKITKLNGEFANTKITVSDLHDLRYCIDRVLAQLPQERP